MMKSVNRFLALVCALALTLAFSMTALAAEVEPTAFSTEDLTLSGLMLYASQEEAAALLGAPDTNKTVMLEATGESVTIWEYNGLILTFDSDGKLTSAVVTAAEYTGPRGVQLGQTVEEVTGKFYIDPSLPAGAVLYSAGYVDELLSPLPPFGYVQAHEDGTLIIAYAEPETPFDDVLMESPMDFIYERLALFIVDVNADGIVTSFSWSVGPWAE